MTVLLELRARNALDDGAYWKTVADLRAGGHLGGDACGTLLDRLYARKLLDDLGYRRRDGGNLPLAPVPDHKPFLQVAEPGAGYDVRPSPKGGQTDMFDPMDGGLMTAAKKGCEHWRGLRTIPSRG